MSESSMVPLSVNYHLTRQCNYKCGFCFHTAITSHMLSLNEAKRGLALLADAGMKKVNFAGGEPFLPKNGHFLGKLCEYCKKELKDVTVSIISNGSLITEKWMEEYGDFVDMLGISLDSFDLQTNRQIGRRSTSVRQNEDQGDVAMRVKELCDKYGIPLKINTVVNALNWQEDMSEFMLTLRPKRWKIFQVLLLEGENSGQASRNGHDFKITKDEFYHFVNVHKEALKDTGLEKAMHPEDNETMRDSYLLLDEYMRFLNCTDNSKKPSPSILDSGGVEAALKVSGFDVDSFERRGGLFDWTRSGLMKDEGEDSSQSSSVASLGDSEVMAVLQTSVGGLEVGRGGKKRNELEW